MYFLRNTSYNKWHSSTPTFLLVVRLDAFKKPPQHALNAVGPQFRGAPSGPRQVSLEQRCPPNEVGLGFVNGKPTKAIYKISINLSPRLHMLNSHEWITSS